MNSAITRDLRCMLPARAVCAVVLATALSTGWGHDTWFKPEAPAPAGAQLLALGTGVQYPKQESGIATEYLRQRGCAKRDGGFLALTAVRNVDTALIVSAPAGATSCWVQLTPFDIELMPDKIDLYLHEIRPPQAMLDAWAAMHARGLPWKERYTKHARIELPGRAGAAQATDMGMDVLLDAAANASAGDTFIFQVLRDGAPLREFAVELRSDRTPFGIWRRTDADGRLRFEPPFAGRWLLRGVDLRLSDSVPDSWDSRFVALIFDVAPKAAPAPPAARTAAP